MTLVCIFLDIFLQNELMTIQFRRTIIILSFITAFLLVFYAKRSCEGCFLANTNALAGYLLFMSILGMISTHLTFYFAYFLMALAAIHVDNLISVLLGTMSEDYPEAVSDEETGEQEHKAVIV